MAERVQNSDNNYTLGSFCDVCSSDGRSVEALSICVDCMDFLCVKCLGTHSTNIVLKAHTIIEKDIFDESLTSATLRKIKEILFCSEHGTVRKYTCEDHAVFVCEMCVIRNHRTCANISESALSSHVVLKKVQDVKLRIDDIKQRKYEQLEVLKKEHDNIAELQFSLLGQVNDFLEHSGGSHTDNLRVAKLKIICDLSKIKDKEDQQLYNEQLLHSVMKLNDKNKAIAVAAYINLSLRGVDSHLDGLSNHEQRKANTTEFVEKLRILQNNCAICHNYRKAKPFQDMQLMAMIKDAYFKGPEVESVAVQTEFYSKNSNDTDKCTKGTGQENVNVLSVGDSVSGQGPYSRETVNVSGSRRYKSRDASSQTCCSDYVKPDTPLTKRSLEFAGVYNICTKDEISCAVSGIVVLNDKRIVVADFYNSEIKVFDEFFGVLFSKKTSSSPISLCNIADRTIAVASTSRRLNIYTITHNSVIHTRGIDIGLHCRGICNVNVNQIAILSTGLPVYNNCGDVHQINSERHTVEIQYRQSTYGRRIKTISKFSKKIESPIYIVNDISGNIVLGEVDRLTAVDQNGQFQWSYQGNKSHKLDGLQGMDMDSEGNIYVCGQASNNIHQVSCLDYKCNRVIIPYVPSPRSVAYDPYHDRLIVGSDGRKCLYVYNFV